MRLRFLALRRQHSWGLLPKTVACQGIIMALQLQFCFREQRHDQIYPTLDPLEIERVRRFGNLLRSSRRKNGC